MRILTWAVLLVLFVLLLAFAAKNADPVTLRFYFDLALQAPLILLLFCFFLAGAVLGLMSRQLTVFGLKRELRELKRARAAATAAPAQPGPAEG
jgi:uncharacterized integral membrane protein